MKPVPGNLRFSEEASLPTIFGNFRGLAVWEEDTREEHLVLIRGEIEGREDVPVRLHSECLTGDVIGSLRCDCRNQLQKALQYIANQEIGVLIYLRQEGRGIGLMNKIRAYSLQEKGLDTVEANERLGFQNDHREYGVAIRVLEWLKASSIVLITNNPEKLEAMKKGGVRVSQRIPLVVRPNQFNESYLKTKETKLGHLLGDDEELPPGVASSPSQGRSV